MGKARFLLLLNLKKGIRMLEIYGRSDSSNVQAVMWCVAELGLEYVRYDIGHRFGGTNTKEFIDMNPNQTVHVLRDKDGLTLWESGAILRYLANQYGDDQFWPHSPNLRANIYGQKFQLLSTLQFQFFGRWCALQKNNKILN